jgi:hypothetical protein
MSLHLKTSFRRHLSLFQNVFDLSCPTLDADSRIHRTEGRSYPGPASACGSWYGDCSGCDAGTNRAISAETRFMEFFVAKQPSESCKRCAGEQTTAAQLRSRLRSTAKRNLCCWSCASPTESVWPHWRLPKFAVVSGYPGVTQTASPSSLSWSVSMLWAHFKTLRQG